ncbi:hypothetical protein VTH82DRAFT_3788 [Thermothelomyces myriococcoides]
MSGVKGLNGKVVDDISSKLGLPSLEAVETIDADHRQMVKCSNKEDPRYEAIHDVLRDFIDCMSADRNPRDEPSAPASFHGSSTTGAGRQPNEASTYRGSLPYYYIPLPENPRFVGRKETLDTLKARLFENKECRKAAIVGLGGVGKTQIALQLAYWTKKYRPEFSIFWVPALSNATFDQAFTALAKMLPIQSDGKDDNLKDSVRQYLISKAAGPWLLVVDNADDKDILFGSANMPCGISKYLPENDDSITIFTTRSLEIAVEVVGSDVIELHEMSPSEAANFFENSLIQKDLLRDKAATANLLEKLTYFPLAIAQAAAYINIKRIPLAQYVELLHGTEQDMVSLMSKEFRDHTRYPGVQNAVATTWLQRESGFSNKV